MANIITQTKIRAGWYKISNGTSFSNVKHVGNLWTVDLRKTSTGELIKHGDDVRTLKDAHNEFIWLIATPLEKTAILGLEGKL